MPKSFTHWVCHLTSCALTAGSSVLKSGKLLKESFWSLPDTISSPLPDHITKIRIISCMVNHNIYHNTNTAVMCLIDQCLEFFFCSKRWVQLCKIACPISMVCSIVRNIFFSRVSYRNSRNIFYNRSNPDCINSPNPLNSLTFV